MWLLRLVIVARLESLRIVAILASVKVKNFVIVTQELRSVDKSVLTMLAGTVLVLVL